MNWVSKSLLHSPHFPDLAPSDDYLFSNLKRWLCGRRFESNEEVERETKGYFERSNKSYYLDGMEKLKVCLTRCIELKGEYIKGLPPLATVKKSIFLLHFFEV